MSELMCEPVSICDSEFNASFESANAESAMTSNTECHEHPVLKFFNIFLIKNGLHPISDVTEFIVDKDLLLDEGNATLYLDEFITELEKKCDGIHQIHLQNLRQRGYMLKMIGFIVRCISNDECKYRFVVGDTCKVVCDRIKPKKQTICACLRNAELRKQVRSRDETINCVCGLFEYRNSFPITHRSYGDGRLHGQFSFTDLNVLYDFILNSRWKDKYFFVESPRSTCQAFFDLDYKFEKYGLKEHVPDEQVGLIEANILSKICEVLENREYIYSDKTIGLGVHLYFPNVIVDKKRLAKLTARIKQELISENAFGFSSDVVGKIYNAIVDDNVCNSGLALMFQVKDDGSYYMINVEKSTFPSIPDDKLEQLKLCTLTK